MLITDEVIMNNIQKLSLSLTTPQLDQFVTVIESLTELLQVANEDTEKAYRMYLNSTKSSKEDEHISAQILPIYHGATNITPIKH